MEIEIDFTKCIACQGPAKGGKWQNEELEKKHQFIPVCKECYDSGKFAEWWDKTLKEIKELCGSWAFEKSFFSGNPLIDVQRLRKWKLNDQRIEDGVCPNGCARLNARGENTGDWECPVCHFVQHYRKF